MAFHAWRALAGTTHQSAPTSRLYLMASGIKPQTPKEISVNACAGFANQHWVGIYSLFFFVFGLTSCADQADAELH